MAVRVMYRQWTCGKCARTIQVKGWYNPRGFFSNSASTAATLSSSLMQQKLRHKQLGCQQDKGSGCFVTTAAVRALGLPDDCEALKVLRQYRDGWLRHQAFGRSVLSEYGSRGPAMVQRIESRREAKDIWQQIYDEVVLRAARLASEGRNEEVHKFYERSMADLWARYGPAEGSR
jgi:hypothetical protein